VNTQILHRLPATVAAPRSVWLERLARVGRAIWSALEAEGQSRGRRELLAAAERYEDIQPELARSLRAAARELPQR